MPPFYLRNSFIQTVLPQLFRDQHILLVNNYQKIDLGNDESLLINLENCEQNANNTIVVMSHGLGGSEDSGYMIRTASLLLKHGYGVVRVNSRNAGPAFGLSLSPNNAGRSQDLLAVIKHLSNSYPNSQLIHLGFSLSGNQGLKMLGEGGLPANLIGAVEVCPPCDLKKTSAKILKSQLGIYDWFFTRTLKEQINQINKLHHGESFNFESKKLDLYQIDEEYTAPKSGYQSADQYYQLCSSKNFLDEITIPTEIIATENDPVIDNSFLLEDRLPDKINLYIDSHGGHVGFVDRKNHCYLDKILLDKLSNLTQLTRQM